MFDAFGAPQLIGLVFGAVAAPMALASWVNSRLVGRYGLRRVGHSAALAFAIVSVAHAALAFTSHESLLAFVVLQGLAMACFAFTSSNLGTLAMEHMAPIAGTASSVQGVIGTVVAAGIGFVIGRAFDGTARPFLVGLALCALVACALIALTEPTRLFAGLAPGATEPEEPCMPEDIC